MRSADLVTASILALLGGLVVADAVRLGIGWGTDGPRSGFFPFWLAVLLILTSGLIILQATLRVSAKPFVTRERLSSVLKVLWPAAGMVFLIHFLGLYLASALYIGFYMRWVGRHSWLAVIALSIGIPVVTFIVFEQWFLVQMPKGPVEAWLGY